MNQTDVPSNEASTQAGAPRCPRQAGRAAEGVTTGPCRPILWREMHEEPFRLFFPIAVLAGLVGVLLWPAMIAGWMTDYPGLRHARLMTHGFFGGFILGFLGTSMPKLLEVKLLTTFDAVLPLLLHFSSVVAHACGATIPGDALFASALVSMLAALGRRFPDRKDLPPPGFVLLGLGFLCGLVGMMLQQTAATREWAPGWDLLGRLCGYHAFVLLCILGAGGFLLPRFLGLGVKEKFTMSRTPSAEWSRALARAALTGVLLIATYPMEAFEQSAAAGLLRAGLIGAYLWSVMPFGRLKWSWSGVQWLLVMGLVFFLIGVVSAGIWTGWRVGLSHFELLGGFGLITIAVATRVVFGHSGQREKLERFHPTLTTAAGLMLLGMVNRITGDLVPSTMATHYLYGALCWSGGLLLWAVCVLPAVLVRDTDVEP